MFVILLLASILQAIIVALGFILLVIPGVYLLVRYLFISQAIVLEHKGIGGAFSRSGELVRGSWWRVFGIGLVLFLLVAVIQQAGGGVIVGILSLGRSTTGHLIGDAVNAVVRIIVLPIELGGLTLLYYDLRIRKEGFDLQQMAQTLGRTPPGP